MTPVMHVSNLVPNSQGLSSSSLLECSRVRKEEIPWRQGWHVSTYLKQKSCYNNAKITGKKVGWVDAGIFMRFSFKFRTGGGNFSTKYVKRCFAQDKLRYASGLIYMAGVNGKGEGGEKGVGEKGRNSRYKNRAIRITTASFLVIELCQLSIRLMRAFTLG